MIVNKGYAIRVDESDNDVIKTKSGLELRFDSDYGDKYANHKQKGILIGHGENLPRLPTGATIYYHHLAIDNREVIDGEVIYFAELEHIIAYDEGNGIVAFKDKTICSQIDTPEKNENGIYLPITKEKSVGKVISSEIYKTGETVIFWSQAYPFYYTDTEELICVNNKYIVKSDSIQNENFVLIEPQDEGWIETDKGIYLPKNTQVPVGLAKVVSDGAVFKKGDLVLHEKRSFNSIRYLGGVHAVRKEQIYGVIN